MRVEPTLCGPCRAGEFCVIRTLRVQLPSPSCGYPNLVRDVRDPHGWGVPNPSSLLPGPIITELLA